MRNLDDCPKPCTCFTASVDATVDRGGTDDADHGADGAADVVAADSGLPRARRRARVPGRASLRRLHDAPFGVALVDQPSRQHGCPDLDAQPAALLWAWFYNVAAIPIAALGLLHPMLGVIAMTASSLSVIGNFLLYRRYADRVTAFVPRLFSTTEDVA